MQVYSVSEFVHGINELLSEIPACVQGEVSNFHITQNRFVWFELKDDKSYISCFLLAFQLDQPLENGMEIQVLGRPGLFVKSGKFHLRVQKIQVVGEGSLKRQYELLKAQLTKEGLFDTERKRPLPKFPQTVGLITSKDAAAYTDVLRILKNRWAGLRIIHFPVNVQGEAAVPSIVQAFRTLNAHYTKTLDVVIVTRGGGSMEDLQAFNQEAVVRAVFACKVPTVAAIGHERDDTLTEYAADVRASTPSNAAEFIVPDKRDVIQQLHIHAQRQLRALENMQSNCIQRTRHQVLQLQQQVHQYMKAIQLACERFTFATTQWEEQVHHHMTDVQHHVALLRSYDPKATLQRGYSITRTASGQVLTSTKQVKAQEQISTLVADGTITSEVL